MYCFRRFISLISFIFLISISPATAQKVGLVLSGGGSSGLSHIGVLKALEENDIPVDYIAGTSMGALIGAMYAIGMTPEQIETAVLSQRFRDEAAGVIDDKYLYYFKSRDENASWITIKFSRDSVFKTSIPTNIISSYPMDFGLMEYFAPAIAAAGYKFDSLFIPYRCVAADIEAKRQVVFHNGDLAEAVRASISFPFYMKPVKVNGKLLFDGGLYNNFPSDVMLHDFYPDVIIGSTVASNPRPPDENDVISQIKTMLMSQTNFSTLCENGIIIQPPDLNVGLFDFSNVKPIIDAGYKATLARMDEIKREVHSRITYQERAEKRVSFKSKMPNLDFDNIYINGLNRSQAGYVRDNLRHKKSKVPLEQLKKEYFKLAADDKIKSIYPKAKFNKETGYFDLYLDMKKDNDLRAQFGGNFSSKNINETFLGFEFKDLSSSAVSIAANSYFGRFYTSGLVKARADYPLKVPFYLEAGVALNRWDYFNSTSALFDQEKPSYLVLNDKYFETNVGLPFTHKGKVKLGFNFANILNQYYQRKDFLKSDAADNNSFNCFSLQALYEENTLNRKQYASEGKYFTLRARFVDGLERNTPGSTSFTHQEFRKTHQWLQVKALYDRYFNRRGNVKFGVYAEAVYSMQEFFSNYTSSILMAPVFNPVPESKTLFFENFRAYKYAAVGLKNIEEIYKNLDLRIEAYLFQPYREIIKNPDFTASFKSRIDNPMFMGTGAIVYNTRIGPVCLSVNYYEGQTKSWSFLFHFGYIMFNDHALK